MGLGEFDGAIATGKRAIELDPLSLINNADLGWVYCCARRYDEAIAQARKTLEMDPSFYLARYYLGHALQFSGQLTEATAEYQKAAETDDDPVVLALLGQAYARTGQRRQGAGNSRAPDRRGEIALRLCLQFCDSLSRIGRAKSRRSMRSSAAIAKAQGTISF